MAIITDIERLRIKSFQWDGENKDLNNLISCLERELYNSPISGIGLSAIQINIPIQVAIIRTNKLYLNLYNTTILEGSEFIISKEGCLSIPNIFGELYRMNKITIKNGDGRIYKLTGLESIVVQHEIDHWFGILFTDRLIKKED